MLSVFDAVVCSWPLRLWERTLSLCAFVPGLWRGRPEGQQVEQVVTGGEMALITLCSPGDVVADVGCVIEESQLLGVSEVTPRRCWWFPSLMTWSHQSPTGAVANAPTPMLPSVPCSCS